MFQIDLRIKAQPSGAIEAVKALRSFVNAAQLERGFISSRIYQQPDDTEELCLIQDWSSEAELKSYIRSDRFTALLMFMETAPEKPVLEIHLASQVVGLEYVEAVRFREI